MNKKIILYLLTVFLLISFSVNLKSLMAQTCLGGGYQANHNCVVAGMAYNGYSVSNYYVCGGGGYNQCSIQNDSFGNTGCMRDCLFVNNCQLSNNYGGYYFSCIPGDNIEPYTDCGEDTGGNIYCPTAPPVPTPPPPPPPGCGGVCCATGQTCNTDLGGTACGTGNSCCESCSDPGGGTTWPPRGGVVLFVFHDQDGSGNLNVGDSQLSQEVLNEISLSIQTTSGINQTILMSDNEDGVAPEIQWSTVWGVNRCETNWNNFSVADGDCSMMPRCPFERTVNQCNGTGVCNYPNTNGNCFIFSRLIRNALLWGVSDLNSINYARKTFSIGPSQDCVYFETGGEFTFNIPDGWEISVIRHAQEQDEDIEINSNTFIDGRNIVNDQIRSKNCSGDSFQNRTTFVVVGVKEREYPPEVVGYDNSIDTNNNFSDDEFCSYEDNEVVFETRFWDRDNNIRIVQINIENQVGGNYLRTATNWPLRVYFNRLVDGVIPANSFSIRQTDGSAQAHAVAVYDNVLEKYYLPSDISLSNGMATLRGGVDNTWLQLHPDGLWDGKWTVVMQNQFLPFEQDYNVNLTVRDLTGLQDETIGEVPGETMLTINQIDGIASGPYYFHRVGRITNDCHCAPPDGVSLASMIEVVHGNFDLRVDVGYDDSGVNIPNLNMHNDAVCSGNNADDVIFMRTTLGNGTTNPWNKFNNSEGMWAYDPIISTPNDLRFTYLNGGGGNLLMNGVGRGEQFSIQAIVCNNDPDPNEIDGINPYAEENLLGYRNEDICSLMVSRNFRNSYLPWFQVSGGLVGVEASGGQISQTIAEGGSFVENTSVPSGIIIDNIGIGGTMGNNYFHTNTNGNIMVKYDYNYWYQKLNGENLPIGVNWNQQGIYKIENDESWSIDEVNENIIVLIDGDLTINNNIEVDAGKALLVIIRGDLMINPSVIEIEGIFMMGDVNTGGGYFRSGSGNSNLTVYGSVIAYGGLDLQRNLGVNNNNPAEKFIYNSGMIKVLEQEFEDLLIFKYNWREVGPGGRN